VRWLHRHHRLDLCHRHQRPGAPGVPRLAALLEANGGLSSGDLADLLMKEVDTFTEGAPLQDDRTLVVMKVL